MRRRFHKAVLTGLLATTPLLAFPFCVAQQHDHRQYGQPQGYHGGFVSTPGRIPVGAPQPMSPGQHIQSGNAPQFVMPYVAPMYGAGGAAVQHGESRYQPGDHDRGRNHDPHRQSYSGYALSPWVYANTWETLPPADSFDQSASGNESYGAANAANEQSPAPGALPQNDGIPPQPPPDPYRQPYQPSQAPAAAPPVAPTILAQEPELTLVFKNGHQQSVRNYVLTPTTVIDLDHANKGRQQTIPLAELNIAATEKAAEAAGLDFHPPVRD